MNIAYRLVLTSTLAAIVALTSSRDANSQVEHIVDIPDQLWLPQGYGPCEWPSLAYQMASFRTTLGDLDGNGVPDIVLSNGVASLTVHLMAEVAGQPVLLSSHTILAPPPDCAMTGDGARARTIAQTRLDTALVYDIDLDGVAELIYLNHAPSGSGPGEVRLAVYKYEFTSHSFIEQALSYLSLVPKDQDHNHAGGGLFPLSNYFGADCACGKQALGTINLRVGNIRGRVLPQDILVWAGHPNGDGKRYWVYGYDSDVGSGARLTKLDARAMYDCLAAPDPYGGERGHSIRFADLDFDGVDEIIGRRFIKYDASLVPPIASYIGGIVTNSIDACVAGVLNHHPDHVLIADFLKTYRDESSGEIVPAPGMEILAAVETAQAANPSVQAGHAGPWIYRGMSGHSLGTTGVGSRKWPRKLLNLVQSFNSFKNEWYWYGSTATQTKQPASVSRWGELIQELAGSFDQKNPDVQALVAADLVAESPGLELLALSKANLTAPGCGHGHVFYLFGSTPDLVALSWGESQSSPGARAPTIHKTFPLDWKDSRSPVEVFSVTGANCGVGAHDIFEFVPSLSGPKAVVPVSLHHRPVGLGETLAFHDGVTAADVIGDSREELVFYTFAGTTKRLHIIEGPSTVLRTEPPPWRYLAYRTRVNNAGGYDGFIDFAKLDGLRIAFDTLPRGKSGSFYGRAQDETLVATLVGADKIGAGLIAEGGVPPYSFSIVVGGVPLNKAQLDLGPGDGAIYWLHGRCQEVGAHRFRLRVTDSASPPAVHEQDFVVHIDEVGLSIPNRRPVIRAAGFDGAFAVSGVTTTVPVKAWVDDVNDNVVAVSVRRVDTGAIVTNLLDLDNDGVWTGAIPVGFFGPGAHLLQIQALDSSNLLATPWPYLVLEGGPEVAEVSLEPAQTIPAALVHTTPTISHVERLAVTVESGEVSNGTGQVTVRVHAKDLKGLVVDRVELVVRPHSSPDRRYSTALVAPTGTVFELTVDVPNEEFGWGHHGVFARIVCLDAGVERASDWWPYLVVHE